MDYSDFPLYGVCPLYDDCVLVRCDICQLVLKVSQLADHLAKRHDIHESPSSIAQALSSSSQTLPVSVLSDSSSSASTSSNSGNGNVNSVGGGSNGHNGGDLQHQLQQQLQIENQKARKTPTKLSHDSNANKLANSNSDDSTASSLLVENEMLDVNAAAGALIPAATTTAVLTANTTTTNYIEFESDFDSQTSLARLLEINNGHCGVGGGGVGAETQNVSSSASSMSSASASASGPTGFDSMPLSASLNNLECVIDSVATIDVSKSLACLDDMAASLGGGSSGGVGVGELSNPPVYHQDATKDTFKLVDKLKSKINESKKKEAGDGNGGLNLSPSDESKAAKKKSKSASSSSSASSTSSSSSNSGNNNNNNNKPANPLLANAAFLMSEDSSQAAGMPMMTAANGVGGGSSSSSSSAAMMLGGGQPIMHAPIAPPQLDTSISLDNLNDFEDLIMPKSEPSSGAKQSSAGKPKPNTKTSKVYDPDKHCGVVTEITDPINGHKSYTEPCTRSLTCKKHSINLRRQVQGRSRTFNDLFKQYRDEKLNCNTGPDNDAALSMDGGDSNQDAKSLGKKKSPNKKPVPGKKEPTPAESMGPGLGHQGHMQMSMSTGFDGEHQKHAMDGHHHHHHHHHGHGHGHHAPGMMQSMDHMGNYGGGQGMACFQKPMDAAYGPSNGVHANNKHLMPQRPGLDYNGQPIKQQPQPPQQQFGSSPLATMPPQHQHHGQPQYVGQQMAPQQQQQQSPRIGLSNADAMAKHHPRPAAVNSFNARMPGNGGGGYPVWNRQQDNLRYVLNNTFSNEPGQAQNAAVGANGAGVNDNLSNYHSNMGAGSSGLDATGGGAYYNGNASYHHQGQGYAANGQQPAQTPANYAQYSSSVNSVNSYNPTMTSAGYNGGAGGGYNDNMAYYQQQAPNQRPPAPNNAPMYQSQMSAVGNGGMRQPYETMETPYSQNQPAMDPANSPYKPPMQQQQPQQQYATSQTMQRPQYNAYGQQVPPGQPAMGYAPMQAAGQSPYGQHHQTGPGQFVDGQMMAPQGQMPKQAPGFMVDPAATQHEDATGQKPAKTPRKRNSTLDQSELGDGKSGIGGQSNPSKKYTKKSQSTEEIGGDHGDAQDASSKAAKKPKGAKAGRAKKQTTPAQQGAFFGESASPAQQITLMPNPNVARQMTPGKVEAAPPNGGMIKSEFAFAAKNDVSLAMPGHQMMSANGGQQHGKTQQQGHNGGGGTMDDFDNLDFDNIANFFDSGQPQHQQQQQAGTMSGANGGQSFPFAKSTSSSFINDGSSAPDPTSASNVASNPSYLSEMAAIDGIKNQIKRAYLSSSSSPSSNSINSMPSQQQQHQQQQMMMSQAQHHQHQQPHMQQTQPGHYHQVHSNAATGGVYGGGGHLQASQTGAQTNSSSSYSIDDDLLFEQFSGDYYNPIGMFSTSGGGGGAKMNASSSSTSISNMGSGMHLGGGGGVGVSGGMNSMINSYNGVVPSMREPLKSASSISLSPSPSSSSSSSSSSMPLGGGGNGVVVGGSLVNSTSI